MNNMAMKNEMDAQQLSMVQSEMSNKQKSKGIAYALWFFLSVVGGHRFYAGDTGIGIGMLLTFGGLGIWSLIDVFFIGKRIETVNEDMETKIIQQVRSFSK